MLSCHCLNVIVETCDDFADVPSSTFELSEEESEDTFFKEEFRQVGKLLNINKVHCGLIETRNVGLWIVHQCINCNISTHALHRDKGASRVLVSSKLLISEEISNLKNSDLYSKIFNIIVYSSDSGDNGNNLHVDAYLPKDILSTVKHLKEITTDALKKETLAVEERIKKYAEHQYNELENLKDKTCREQEDLIRLIVTKCHEKSNVSKSSAKTVQSSCKPIAKPDSFFSTALSTKTADEYPKVNERHIPQRQKSSPGAQVTPHSYETMFIFDGDINNELLFDSDTSEGVEDDDDDVIETPSVSMSGKEVNIPNSKVPAHRVIAKSLPVSIPTYTLQASSHDEDFKDKRPNDENVDIAASIKALAQSVHSDAIFGDLPRPRLSTLK